MTSPQQAWAAPTEDSLVERDKPQWRLATLAGLAAGLGAAVLYAVVSTALDREILYFIIAVGVVAAYVVARIVKIASPITALISLLVGAVSVAAAIYLLQACLFWGDLPSALSHLDRTSTSLMFSSYFDDPLGYLWAGAGVVAAFVVGRGSFRNSTGTAGASATASQPVQHITPLTPPEL